MLPFGRADAAAAPLFQSTYHLASDTDTDNEADGRDATAAAPALADARADADDGDLLDPFLDSSRAPPSQPSVPISSAPPPHAYPARLAVGMPTLDPALSSPFLDAPRPPSPRTQAAQEAHRSILRLQRQHTSPRRDEDESSVSYSDDESEGTASLAEPGRRSSRRSDRPHGESAGSFYDSTPSGSFGGRWGNPLRMHKAQTGRSYLAPPRPPTSLSSSSAFLQQDVYDEQLLGLQPSVALPVPSQDKGSGAQGKDLPPRTLPQESDADASDESGMTETVPRRGKRRSDSDPRSAFPRALFAPASKWRGDGRGGEESIPMLNSTTGSVLGGKATSRPRGGSGHAHPDANRHIPLPLLTQGVSPAAATWVRERHDLWALVLFLIFVLPVLVLGILGAWEAPSLPYVPGQWGEKEPLHDALLRTAPLLALSSVVAGGMGIFFFSILQRLARAQNRTQGSRKFNVILNLFRSMSAAIPFALAAASIALLGGSFSPSTPFSWLLPLCAGVCAVAAVRTGMKVWKERKKLPQASRTAILAAHVVGTHPSLALVAALSSVVLIALALLCLVLLTRLAAVAAARAVPLPSKGRKQEPASDAVGLAPLPLSLALLLAWGWATSTGLNALKLITSAAVSHWYFYSPSSPSQPNPHASDSEDSLPGSSSGMSTDLEDTHAPAATEEDQVVFQAIHRALGPALGSVMAASLLRTALTLVRGLILLARAVVQSVSWLHHAALARSAAVAGQAALLHPASASIVLGGGVLAGLLGWLARILDPLAYLASLVVGVEAVVEEHASNAILYTGITGAPMAVASRRAAALRSTVPEDGRALPPLHGARVLRRLGTGLTYGLAALVAALGASYASVVRDEPGGHALVTAVVCSVPPLLVGTALTGLLIDAAETLVMCYLMDLAAGTQHCPLVEEAFAPPASLPRPATARTHTT